MQSYATSSSCWSMNNELKHLRSWSNKQESSLILADHRELWIQARCQIFERIEDWSINNKGRTLIVTERAWMLQASSEEIEIRTTKQEDYVVKSCADKSLKVEWIMQDLLTLIEQTRQVVKFCQLPWVNLSVTIHINCYCLTLFWKTDLRSWMWHYQKAKSASKLAVIRLPIKTVRKHVL